MESDHRPGTEEDLERLIASLSGVVSARVVVDDAGRVIEIHVLASPALHPKQIVRNVESALSAGRGIVVDRRFISVAPLRPDVQIPGEPHAPPAPPAEPPPRRPVLIGFETSTGGPFDARCTVTLACEAVEVVGRGSGANTTQGRAEAAAHAVLDAIASFDPELSRIGLDGAALVESNGRSYILVSAHALEGRHPVLLTGVSPLTRSPEEAGILACLQATNRNVEHALF